MATTLAGVQGVYRKVTAKYPAVGALRMNKILFGNALPFRLNMTYWSHLRRCRRAFPSAAGLPAQAQAIARQLREQGYAIFPPSDRALTASIAERVAPLAAIGGVSGMGGVEDWMIQVPECVKQVPEMFRLLRPEIVDAIEAYFRSHFKIYSAEIYRLVPTQQAMEASGLWHTDNYPPGILKAMIYLTDCTRTNGALRVHPRPLTRRLLRAGFFDRHHTEPFAGRLASHHVPLEAPAGSVVLWDSNLIHRGTPPDEGLRDAIAFKFLPSTEPWTQHLARVGEGVTYERRIQFPKDPSED